MGALLAGIDLAHHRVCTGGWDRTHQLLELVCRRGAQAVGVAGRLRVQGGDEAIPDHQFNPEMVEVVLKRSPVPDADLHGVGGDQNASSEQGHADFLGFLPSRKSTMFTSSRLTRVVLKCTINKIVFNIYLETRWIC